MNTVYGILANVAELAVFVAAALAVFAAASQAL
jgi:hypothetical protein